MILNRINYNSITNTCHLDSEQSGWCPRSARSTANSECQSLLKTSRSWLCRAWVCHAEGGACWEITSPTPAVVTK